MLEKITKAIAALPAEQHRAWREAHGSDEDSALSLRWETSPMWTPEHRDAVAAAIHDICIGSKDASEALSSIALINRDLGALLACAIARSVLHLVDELDERPRYAVESAELLISGVISREECQQGIRGAATSYNQSFNNAAMAAYRAGAFSVLSRAGVSDFAMAAEVCLVTGSAAYAVADKRCSNERGNHMEMEKVMKELRSVLGAAARDAIDAVAALHERSKNGSE